MNDKALKEWPLASKYKPDSDEPVLVQEMDASYNVASWVREDRLWVTKDFNLVDVYKWCYIPEGAD